MHDKKVRFVSSRSKSPALGNGLEVAADSSYAFQRMADNRRPPTNH